jgi:hypothetical protein
MNAVATIEFRDAVSGDDGIAVVRAAPGVVGLALSLRGDGDIELFLPPDAARPLLDAIRQAVVLATTAS